MKIAIMQPYFFPYIGYFQLMNAVDEFVVYDNIEYTKKGWINRNRILVNGKDAYITLPLKKDSDYLDIRQRSLADIWNNEKTSLLNRIKAAYQKAPQFSAVFPIIEGCLLFENDNLFQFLFHSLNQVKSYLGIHTPFRISSTIDIPHKLKAEHKVIAICKALKADYYLNSIGGVELYSVENFKEAGIDLHFFQTTHFQYPQFENPFIPFLSILDVMMFNSVSQIQQYLDKNYTLL